jgi:hypothetical protein
VFERYNLVSDDDVGTAAERIDAACARSTTCNHPPGGRSEHSHKRTAHCEKILKSSTNREASRRDTVARRQPPSRHAFGIVGAAVFAGPTTGT